MSNGNESCSMFFFVCAQKDTYRITFIPAKPAASVAGEAGLEMGGPAKKVLPTYRPTDKKYPPPIMGAKIHF